MLGAGAAALAGLMVGGIYLAVWMSGGAPDKLHSEPSKSSSGRNDKPEAPGAAARPFAPPHPTASSAAPLAEERPPSGDPPQLTITAPSQGHVAEVGAPVAFAASWSDPDGLGDIRRIAWDFGDGSPVRVLDPEDGKGSLHYAFTGPGQFLATLTVTDAAGLSASDAILVRISLPGRPPEMSITQPLAGATVLVNATVEFTGTWTDADGLHDVASVEWRWGDGSPPEAVSPSRGSDSRTHRFSRTGFFQIGLFGADAAGQFSRRWLEINVSAPGGPPYATIIEPFSRTFLERGKPVKAASAWSDPDGLRDIRSVVWEWGDGTASDALNPLDGQDSRTHAFARAGDIQLVLIVTDYAGQIWKAERAIRVEESAPPAL